MDQLYARVSDQHLHRLLDAMAHIEATLSHVSAQAAAPSPIDTSPHSPAAAQPLRSESLKEFMQRTASIREDAPLHLSAALTPQRRSYSSRERVKGAVAVAVRVSLPRCVCARARARACVTDSGTRTHNRPEHLQPHASRIAPPHLHSRGLHAHDLAQKAAPQPGPQG